MCSGNSHTSTSWPHFSQRCWSPGEAGGSRVSSGEGGKFCSFPSIAGCNFRRVLELGGVEGVCVASDGNFSWGSILYGEVGLASLGLHFTGDSRSHCTEAGPTGKPTAVLSWCSGEVGTADSAVAAVDKLVAAAACDSCRSAAFWKNDSIALAGFCRSSLLGLLKNLTLALPQDMVFWLVVAVPSGWVSPVRKVVMPVERVTGSENLLAESCTEINGGDLQRTDQHQLRHQPGKQEIF